MKKSIKLNDEVFFDSTGIVHEKENLADTLNRIKYSRVLVLNYANTNILNTEITDITDLYENRNKYVVALTLKAQDGTPYGQVGHLEYQINSNNHLIINAVGSGFVNGHVLVVSAMIYKTK